MSCCDSPVTDAERLTDGDLGGTITSIDALRLFEDFRRRVGDKEVSGGGRTWDGRYSDDWVSGFDLGA